MGTYWYSFVLVGLDFLAQETENFGTWKIRYFSLLDFAIFQTLERTISNSNSHIFPELVTESRFLEFLYRVFVVSFPS